MNAHSYITCVYGCGIHLSIIYIFTFIYENCEERGGFLYKISKYYTHINNFSLYLFYCTCFCCWFILNKYIYNDVICIPYIVKWAFLSLYIRASISFCIRVSFQRIIVWRIYTCVRILRACAHNTGVLYAAPPPVSYNLF